MIVRTQAVVLDLEPLSNTSRRVVWLTRDYGRVTTIIKGAQRPKSFFLGQYDYFYTCELLFYRRGSGLLRTARECSPIKTRSALRRNWPAAAAASYLAGLSRAASPPEAPHPRLFALLDQTLDHLAAHPPAPALLAWFELALLAISGLSPRLDNCLVCGRDIRLGSKNQHFAYARGGLLCPACAKHEKTPARRVTPDVLAALRAWQRSPTPTVPLRTRITPRQMDSLLALVGHMLAYHLELAPPGRRIAVELIRNTTVRPH